VKIVIVGGAGYIGTVLTDELMSHGHDVAIFDLLWFGNHCNLGAAMHERDGFGLTVDDLRGADSLVFMAGLSNDPMAGFSPALNFTSNAALPAYLAYTAKAAGIRRFVYAGSCSVYGYDASHLSDEDGPLECAFPYGISKLQGERGVFQLCDNSFSVISLRQGTVGGFSRRMRFDLVVNAMTRSAAKSRIITVNNPGVWRPLVDVRDTARAFMRAVEADASLSGVFNVAQDNYTVGHIADLVADTVEAVRGVRPSVKVLGQADLRSYKVNTSRAKDVLGWSPRYGVTDTVASLFQYCGDFSIYDDPIYYNVEQFKRNKLNGADAGYKG